MIEDIGRSDGPGRPILYKTTAEFLQHFGLATLHELPQIDAGSVGDTEGSLPNVFMDIQSGEAL
jgi:segregation and condensation protein B